MQLSIIIPAYNIALYIGRCITSCLNQNIEFTEYEIIVIDDGSADNISEVIGPYILKYNNLKIIHQSNKGLSGARNTGMDVAKGEYIWFVDGDDWIAANCLKQLIESINKNQCDILAFDAVFLISDTNQRQTSKIFDVEKNTIRGLDFLKQNQLQGVWNNWFRKDFLSTNKIKFVEGLIHEDGDFNIRSFALAKKVAYLHEPYYFYVCNRISSITNTMTINRAISPIKLINIYMEFIRDNNLRYPDSATIAKVGSNALNVSIGYSAQLNTKDKEKYFFTVKTNMKHLRLCLFRSFQVKYWIEAFALSLFPKKFIKIYHKLKYSTN